MLSVHPKISVIVPSFNQGAFIEETFVSLISQEYPNLEIIVIDGGSKDGTVPVIEKYAVSISYWISEKDSGQSEAINKGFAKATGDIITWLNSDDCYEPGTLHKVAEAFNTDPSLAVWHGKSLLFGEKRASKVIGLERDIALHDYFPFMRFPQPSCFLRFTELSKVLPVNNSLHYAMDFELIVKILLNGGKIKRSDDLLSRYRLHEASKSNHNLAFLKEWSLVVATVFYTLDGGKKYLDFMMDLGITREQQQAGYSCAIQFTEAELESIFLQHLNSCYHFNYREFNTKECESISNFLKTNFFSFYKANNYRKYNNRLKFIPKFVFRLLRAA
jgi:glycosyltransferase involved in cell wall biosynthesis